MPTYNRRELLPRVLEPLLADDVAAELVVVVDGSRDGSIELLNELAARDHRLRPVFIENRGKEGARQAGVEHAQGEIVLLLDDDVLAEPGLVAGHAEAHSADRDLVVVGYMPVRFPSRRRPGDVSTLLYATEYEGRCHEYEHDPSLVLRTLWGGNLSLRREDALRIGFVSEFSQGYHQDRDFGLRCLKAGLRGRFDRRLGAVHLHERSLEAFIRDARRQGAGRLQVHALHPELLPPLRADEFASGLPTPVRELVLACRRPRAEALCRGGVAMTASAAGRLRLWSAETAAVKVLRRIEQQRGALNAA
jgi:glycosyltransferase involved in cell wall biosynthesis